MENDRERKRVLAAEVDHVIELLHAAVRGAHCMTESGSYQARYF